MATASSTSNAPDRGGGSADSLGLTWTAPTSLTSRSRRSATPSRIRRLPPAAGESLTLDTAYIDALALSVARSTQRYVRKGPRRVRYVDLGLSRGFEADLVVDETGLVLRYEHLFERVTALTGDRG
jgi:hypothetical protein